jgi:hypothetical protein
MGAGLLAVKSGFILFIKNYQFPLQINTLERERVVNRVQSLRFRAAITFFFGITAFLYQNQNPVDQMVDGRQFCASLRNKSLGLEFYVNKHEVSLLNTWTDVLFIPPTPRKNYH